LLAEQALLYRPNLTRRRRLPTLGDDHLLLRKDA
jgi:hypothetical protein